MLFSNIYFAKFFLLFIFSSDKTGLLLSVYNLLNFFFKNLDIEDEVNALDETFLNFLLAATRTFSIDFIFTFSIYV